MGIRANRAALKANTARLHALRDTGDAAPLHTEGGLSYYVTLTDGRVKYRGDNCALFGARAEVSRSGDLQRQFAPGKMLAFGVLGATKKKDTRQVYLAVEGTDGGFVASVDPNFEESARKIAMRINTLGKQPEAASP